LSVPGKDGPQAEFVDFLGRHGIASMHAAQSLSAEYLTVFTMPSGCVVRVGCRRLARLLLDWGRSSANGKPEIRFTMALTHEEIAIWQALRGKR